MITKIRDTLRRNADVQAFLAGFVIGWIFSFIVALMNHHGFFASFGRGLIGAVVVGAVFWGVKFAVYKAAPELFEKDDAPREGDAASFPEGIPTASASPAPAGSAPVDGTPSRATAAAAYAAGNRSNEPMFVPPPSANAVREEEERKARYALTRSNVDGLEDDYASTIAASPSSPTPFPAAPPPVTPTQPVAPSGNDTVLPTAPVMDDVSPPLIPSVDPMDDVDKNSNLRHNTTATPPASDTIDAIIAPPTKSLIDDFALDKAKEQMRIESRSNDEAEGSVRGFTKSQSGGSFVYDKNREIKLPNNPEVMARAVRTMLKRDTDGGK